MSVGDLHGCRVLVLKHGVLKHGDLGGAALEEMLIELGCELIAVVSSARQALAALAADGRIDTGVLDIDRPGPWDLAVAEELERRRVPFLFVTVADAAVHLGRHRARPVVKKPVDRAELADALLACCPSIAAATSATA